MKFKGYAHSVVGGREMNQDSYLINDEKGLYAVADGVGGGLRGEVASQMGVKLLEEGFAAQEGFRPLLERIADAVLQEALASCEGEALMGSTLTGVYLQEGLLSLGHIGDSHAYLFDGTVLKCLTEDHEAYDDNMRGPVLASYIGLDTRVYPLTIQTDSVDIKPGNRVLLCSDGLYKQLSDMQVLGFIKQLGSDPEKLLTTLCDEAAKAEYSDNITIVWVEIEA